MNKTALSKNLERQFSLTHFFFFFALVFLLAEVLRADFFTFRLIVFRFFNTTFFAIVFFFAVVLRTTFFAFRLTGFLFFAATFLAFFATAFFFTEVFFLAGTATSAVALVVDDEELHCLMRAGSLAGRDRTS